MATALTWTPEALAYAALYEAIATAAPVLAIVDAANILRHDIEQTPLIDSRNYGDLPSLDIIPTGGGDVNVFHSTDTAMIDMILELEFKTGEEKAGAKKGLWAVRFAVIRALFINGVTLGNQYIEQWNLGAFDNLTPLEVASEFEDEVGWQSTAALTLTLKIPHDELIQ